MKVLAIDQRTDAWHQARLGRLTGSRAANMLAKIKTGEAAARRDYRIDLACERLTGFPADANGFVSKEMQRGIDCEPAAFALYEALTGAVVRRTGFVQHDDVMAGCSLDGDVGNLTGIIELKCPKSATHLRYLRAGVVPPDYLAQVTHNLWVTGAAWCDFASFDDRFPLELQLFRVRVHCGDVDLAAYELAARAFLADVDADVAAVRALVEKSRELVTA